MTTHPHSHLLFDNPASSVWTQKAMAFVTRSHRHLWGKNNEDPLAFLFLKGLKNDFSKSLLLGWNKFGQYRPRENWGLETGGKLFLTPGIVVPYIVDKTLLSVFVHDDKNTISRMVEGSRSPTLVSGDIQHPVLFMFDLFDGLFLAQEAKDTHLLIIHPDVTQAIDPFVLSFLTGTDFIIGRKTDESDQEYLADELSHRLGGTVCGYDDPDQLLGLKT